MMRALYTLLWWVALPLLPLRLWWRGRREPGYREHVGERFGRYAKPLPRGALWVHAVSAGETRAAAPLIARLRDAYPDLPILLTCMTATGRAAGRELYGDTVFQCFLPYDVPFAVRRFLSAAAPRIGVLLETELWPNLVRIGAQAGVPIVLANARLSARSAAGYARLRGFAHAAFGALAGVAAQTADDAARLRALGARDVVVTGNIKFDASAPPAMRELAARFRARFGARRVFIAAATRDGEEALLLEALVRHPLPPGTLTLIVPRHPQRFDDVAALLSARGLAFVRRSDERDVPPAVDIVLGDSMGEMYAYYGAADVAFVGGSLLPLGGQNLIEPLALGVPVLVGPHTFNFADAATNAVAAGAALRVTDADAMVRAAGALLADTARRAAMRERALAFVATHRGAVDRLWAWLAPRLAQRHDAGPLSRGK
ncbi:MAG: lipid IV(A) 3-deoxy-D-manno-octulosonic acid transferase [Proteobacteria bacterium]|nr:lipid IV(A) 3-deoxy-D-manno-octulosonic acid transferase [Pseudomonadota bacterium]